MKIAIVPNIVNIGLNYLLIYGLPQLGLASLGVLRRRHLGRRQSNHRVSDFLSHFENENRSFAFAEIIASVSQANASGYSPNRRPFDR
ncbi:MAG: hypothetical protein MZU97_00225 [Bacillus subtilis]|nr:hypothetical protein [Bacillus subtilis]